MPDDPKPEPVPFPVEVTVNGVRVTVTLMLRPGTTVTAAPLTVESLQPVTVALRDEQTSDPRKS
jgi:hypothetical protein